jgi:hypothetical protein
MSVRTDAIAAPLAALLGEFLDGAPKEGPAYALNRGDAGLLASLDRLSAARASESHDGGAPICAHVEHLRYGLSLMNRWAAGEPDPFRDARWSDAWNRTSVSDREWVELRVALREQAERWLDAIRAPRDVSEAQLADILGSVAHLAYHLGAIRQIDRALAGPPAND